MDAFGSESKINYKLSYGVHENTGFNLKTLNVIYICRIGFGALAAIIAALVVNLKVGNPLINGITIALAVYLLTYYLLKMQFVNKVEKPTKVLSMGIGAFFLTFILCWVLLTTLILVPPTASFAVETHSPAKDQEIKFTSTSTDDGEIVSYRWNFGDNTISTEENPTHRYNTTGEYNVVLVVVDDYGLSDSCYDNITVSESS